MNLVNFVCVFLSFLLTFWKQILKDSGVMHLQSSELGAEHA